MLVAAGLTGASRTPNAPRPRATTSPTSRRCSRSWPDATTMTPHRTPLPPTADPDSSVAPRARNDAWPLEAPTGPPRRARRPPGRPRPCWLVVAPRRRRPWRPPSPARSRAPAGRLRVRPPRRSVTSCAATSPQLGAEAAFVAYRQDTPIAGGPRAASPALVAGLQGSVGTTMVVDPTGGAGRQPGSSAPTAGPPSIPVGLDGRQRRRPPRVRGPGEATSRGSPCRPVRRPT